MSETSEFSISLTQESDYVFRIEFDETPMPDLLTDESAPLGGERGPNPSRLLVAAVANCLSASLLFSLRKFKNAPGTIVTRATGRIERNEHNRLCIGHVAVDINLPDAASDYAKLDRLLEQFENFCVVTESVRTGIPVDVTVRDVTGTVLHESGKASSAAATWMI
jgi:organic hydroperoxide reductase OsmC/OhrA